MSDQTAASEITVRDNPDRRRFEAVDDAGSVAGVSQYRRFPDHIVFTHTEVDDAYEGQGVGSALVQGALDAVRGEGLRVVPQCPFVKSYIERHQEYADLV
jgi:predicted GNAT family acetyltransferase